MSVKTAVHVTSKQMEETGQNSQKTAGWTDRRTEQCKSFINTPQVALQPGQTLAVDFFLHTSKLNYQKPFNFTRRQAHQNCILEPNLSAIQVLHFLAHLSYLLLILEPCLLQRLLEFVVVFGKDSCVILIQSCGSASPCFIEFLQERSVCVLFKKVSQTMVTVYIGVNAV